MQNVPNKGVDGLRALGVIPATGQRLQGDAGLSASRLGEAIVAEVPAYTQSGNPDILPELDAHLKLIIAEACRLLAGKRPGDTGFIAQHAHRRAGQKFPLDALLHTYRIAYLRLMPWIRDAALAVASDTTHVRRVVAAATEFAYEYTGTISSQTTSEYVDHTRRLAVAEGDRRTELLNLLLHGYDEADNRTAQLLRRAGYLEQRQSFCVIVARSVDPLEMENEARAERMATALGDVIHGLPVRSLITVRDNLVTAVISATRRASGWTVPQSLLADRAWPKLRQLGPAVLIGMSADAPSTAHIPRALDEAKLALDFASVADRVVKYAQIPFRHMLVRHAAENIHVALPAWLDVFIAADEKSRGTLLTTLRAYADADMNVLKTAKQLNLHPNTIYARMQKIQDLTGRNPLSYHALTELLLAAECRAI